MTVRRLAMSMVVAILAVLSAGCGNRPAASAITSTAPTAAGSAAASTAPSIAPESTTSPQTALPSGTESAAPPPSPTGPVISEPPAASLAVEGGDPVIGELGSFTWNDGGSDAPWIPGNPMHIGQGERLSLSLASGVRIERWTVARTSGAAVGSGIVGMGQGTGEPVAFPAPPRGSWSVSVSIWFADNLGSASYYWLIAVD